MFAFPQKGMRKRCGLVRRPGGWTEPRPQPQARRRKRVLPMATKRAKAAAPFPIRAGTGEHGMAYCLIKNQEAKTPWTGSDDQYAKMRWGTVDAIIDLRAHGMRERDVIREARRFVREWFDTGMPPNPIGNPAVRTLAHLQSGYPLNGKAIFRGCLLARGFAGMCDRVISDAVRDGLILTRRGRFGNEYRLAHEPLTREAVDLAERVADLQKKQPDGVPFRQLQHVACRILGRGVECGAALIERALNAGILREETRGAGCERYISVNERRLRDVVGK